MYSVENPAFLKKLSRIEEAQYGSRFTGVGAQILGADDKYICQYTEESTNFWGSMFLCYNVDNVAVVLNFRGESEDHER